MKKFILTVFLFLVYSEQVFTQSITRGPYLQMGTPHSIVIRWRTDIATDSQVKYGLTQGVLSLSEDNLTSTTEHEIEITGLMADTNYYYSVGTTALELISGADYKFTTAPLAGTAKATRVWVIGDAGTANTNQQNVRDAFLTFNGGKPADLWVMLGDNAYTTGTDGQYQNAVFDIYNMLLRNSVLWPAFGNHDGYSANSSTQTGVFYDIFTLPDSAQAGGTASGTEAYYSFDYANIHFVCLNSHDIEGTEFDDMVTWLATDLASHTQDWTIAFWHHPPYTKGSHDSDSDSDSQGRMVRMREDVLPILEAGGVDMVLGGHSHDYERSYLLDGHYGYSNTLDPSMILDSGDGRMDGDGAYNKKTLGSASHEGTVYVVAGSSGRTGGGSLNHPAMYTSLNALGSVVLDFNGSQMDLTFIDDNVSSPNILDYMTMLKGQDLPLHVSLTFFRLREVKSEMAVLLQWKTDAELNNYNWLIQRKNEKEASFKTISEMAGQGNTSKATYYDYIDHDVEPGQTYDYRLIDVSINGEVTSHNQLNITVSYPSRLELLQNYPNPFNPETTIKLALPHPSKIDVSVYNQLGQKIKTLLHATQDAGVHLLKWNGKNNNGTEVVSGVYYVIAKSDLSQSRIKVTLIR